MDEVTVLGVHITDVIGKLVFLAVVCGVAYVVQRILSRWLRDGLAKTNIPNASIFVNILRGAVWLVAFLTVLRPVFNVDPNAFITSLGAASIAISLGLQTTISNLVGGISIMVTKVVQPGDFITINGITGEVHDVNWRDTLILDRVGNAVVVPNSQLNSSSIVRLSPELAAMTEVTLTFRAGCDLDQARRQVTDAVDTALAGHLEDGAQTVVRLTTTGSSGTSATVYFHVKPGITFEKARDLAVQAVAGLDCLA